MPFILKKEFGEEEASVVVLWGNQETVIVATCLGGLELVQKGNKDGREFAFLCCDETPQPKQLQKVRAHFGLQFQRCETIMAGRQSSKQKVWLKEQEAENRQTQVMALKAHPQ